MADQKYKAFVSYSHQDERSALDLYNWLKKFRVPRRIARLRGVARLRPLFLDRFDLASSASLSFSIERALMSSESLVLVCSPAAAQSYWVNQEVMFFHKLGRGARVFCFLIEGEPTDAVPPAVFDLIDEPLAADARGSRSNRRAACRRLAAGLLEVPTSELSAWPTTQRRERRMAGPLPTRNRALVSGILRDAKASSNTLELGVERAIAVLQSGEGHEAGRLAMLFTLAESQRRLGDFEQAIQTYQQRLDQLEAQGALGSLEVAQTLHGMSEAMLSLGRENDALACAERALAIKRTVLGGAHLDLSETLAVCANVHVGSGETAKGLAISAQAVEICEAEPQSEELANAIYQQGMLMRHAGRLAEANRVLQRSVDLHRDLYGRLDPRYAQALNALALCLRQSGEPELAKPLYEQVLAIYEGLYADAHPETARARHNYGVLLRVVGDLQGARQNFELALTQWRTLLGENHTDTLTSRHLLARVLIDTGHREEGVDELVDVISRADSGRGGMYKPLAGLARQTLAEVHLTNGDFEKAEVSAREAVQKMGEAFGEDHWRTVGAMRVLSRVLISRSSFDEARIWLERGREALDRLDHAEERELLERQLVALERAATDDS